MNKVEAEALSNLSSKCKQQEELLIKKEEEIRVLIQKVNGFDDAQFRL
jgi:hypothetical protein